MIIGHGGNIYDMAQKLSCVPSEIIDMSSNLNPIGPPPGLITFLKENMNIITTLPEVDSKRVVYAFSNRYDLTSESVLAGNGTTQFIYSLPPALETKNALILGPTYSDYADACIMHGVSFVYSMAEESRAFEPDINQIRSHIKGFDTIFICNPNNPTGVLIPATELELLCRSFPKKNFIIDESYLPFVNCSAKESMATLGLPNVIVLNSMSKIFRIPGLRIGFLISSDNIIKKLKKYLLPWNVNGVAQAAVSYLMTQREEVDAFIKKTIAFIETERKRFTEKIENAFDIKLYPSVTSYILVRLDGKYTSDDICTFMSQDKILIRNCANFQGLSNRFIRISLKTRETNLMLAEKLLKLGQKSEARNQRSETRGQKSEAGIQNS